MWNGGIAEENSVSRLKTCIAELTAERNVLSTELNEIKDKMPESPDEQMDRQKIMEDSNKTRNKTKARFKCEPSV